MLPSAFHLQPEKNRGKSPFHDGGEGKKGEIPLEFLVDGSRFWVVVFLFLSFPLQRSFYLVVLSCPPEVEKDQYEKSKGQQYHVQDIKPQQPVLADRFSA